MRREQQRCAILQTTPIFARERNAIHAIQYSQSFFFQEMLHPFMYMKDDPRYLGGRSSKDRGLLSILRSVG